MNSLNTNLIVLYDTHILLHTESKLHLCSHKETTVSGPQAWSLALGKGLTTPYCKKTACYIMLHRESDLDRFCAMTQAQKREIRFGTWNVRDLYRAGSLKTVASKLVK
jgi:hypothetical protein